MRIALLMLAAIGPALAGCGGGHVAAPSEIIHDQVKVPVPVSCPSADKYTALMASKPTKLAAQPMPATAQERSDKAFAQLGKYEAPGGWVDRASEALSSCQLPPP